MAKLQYHHVRDDLQKNTTPIHVHVDVELVKGKYADYDTFLGQEAVEHLRLYLDERRRGNIDHRQGRRPPELITDDSPIIRDTTRNTPKPVSSKQIRNIVHTLYVKAGLIKEPNGRTCDLRTHSLRKYFKTNLIAAGSPRATPTT